MALGEVFNIVGSLYPKLLSDFESLQDSLVENLDIKPFMTVVGKHQGDLDLRKNVEFFEVFVSIPSLVVNEQKFIGKSIVGHFGNLVYTFAGEESPRELYEVKVCPKCNCEKERLFAFEDSNASVNIQCNTCMRWDKGLSQIVDEALFFPSKLRSFNEVRNPRTKRDATMLCMDLMRFSARIIARDGWISRQESIRTGNEPTADTIRNLMWSDAEKSKKYPETPETIKLAQDAFDWARSMTGNSDWVAKIHEITQRDIVEPSLSGMISSIIGVYSMKARLTAPDNDTHFGTVGDRVEQTMLLQVEKASMYGWKYFCMNDDGQAVIFYTQHKIKYKPGDTIVVSGKIKAHIVERNHNITVLNYVKV